MLHIGRATACEQRFPTTYTTVYKGRLHAEQGELVGCVRALVASPARGRAAAPHRVRARGARLPAQRRRALLRRRHALLAQSGLQRRRLAVLQSAQRLVRAVVPASTAHSVRDATVAAGHGVAGRVSGGVARASRVSGAGPTVRTRLPRATPPR